MDVLRKELNSIYEKQRLDTESLDATVLDNLKSMIRTSVSIDNDCRVITDASADLCFVFAGTFGSLIGLNDPCGVEGYFNQIDSSDEDVIYNRIHPEDLVDKRMLEYEFFKFVDCLPPEKKLCYKATCQIRILGHDGIYVDVANSTQVIQLSPAGKIWLILCRYDLSPGPIPHPGISPRIVNHSTGEIRQVMLSERRHLILTGREREILTLIKDGKLSKEIADICGISINTVNRHRQNILEKLSVGNSMEAVMAAQAMKLL